MRRVAELYGQSMAGVTDGNLKQVNRARKAAGLSVIEPKVKQCLCCPKKFKSMGRGNHLCPGCRYKDGYEP